MTWAEFHTESEALASRAVSAINGEEAAQLYAAAGAAEHRALLALAPEKVRTYSITAVSAVALYYKGKQFDLAESLSHAVLGRTELDGFARHQLRNLLQVIWTTRAADNSGIRFLAGDVLISVKGGDVVFGGAPLDLIVSKVAEVQAVFTRVVEMLLGREFRRRGPAPSDVQQMCTPWLFQVPASSYQFAVRVQEPPQLEMFDEARPKVQQVNAKFLEILTAAAGGHVAELEAAVPRGDYRQGFLRLARNLAPTGKRYDSLEIRDASSPAGHGIQLAKEARRDINRQIRAFSPPAASDAPSTETVTIRGRLRGVQLDNDWLDVQIDGGERTVRVHEASDALDDVVGPMVNQLVVVTVAISDAGRHTYRDIELDE